MVWGLAVGILFFSTLFLFMGFILFKETRTHRFWQAKVDEGDIDMITQLIQVEVERWRTERPPKGTPAAVWQGVQGVELVTIGEHHIHASTAAEAQFAMVGGKRRQVTSALDEAKRITASLAERFFYDIPHIRPKRVQIDCYTTFQQEGGTASQSCILSTEASGDHLAEIDWENDSPEVIAEHLGARYELDERGIAKPIVPNNQPVAAASDASN